MTEVDYKLSQAEKYEQEGKELYAIQIYDSLLSSGHTDRNIIIRLSSLYIKLQNISAFKNLLDAYLSENPEDSEIRLFLAQNLIQKELYDEAITQLSLVEKEDHPVALFLLGYAFFSQKEYEIASINFNNFIKKNHSLELLAESLIFLAKINVYKFNFDVALDLINKSLELVSDNWNGYFIKSVIYYEKKMFAHAQDEIFHALKFNSTSPELCELAGKIFYNNGNYKKAKEFLENSIDLKDVNSEIYALLGNIYLESKNIDKAEEFFNLALQKNSTDIIALNGLNKLNLLKKVSII